MRRLSGILFCMWQIIASVAQAPLVSALLQQGGNVRVAVNLSVVFFLRKWMCNYSSVVPVALVACKHAPFVPSTTRTDNWFFQLQKQTCHKLVPATRPLDIEQDCFFRLVLPGLITLYLSTLRQLSKVCDCFATACVWASSLRSVETSSSSPLFAATRWFSNLGESARDGQKNCLKILIY